MLITSSRSPPQTAKTMWYLVGIGAAIFAIFGIFVGKYLDVQWNAVTQIAAQLSQENNMSLEQAMPIATTLFKGQSVWELMQSRMSWIDLFFGVVAASVAFCMPNVQRLRNFLY